MFGLSIPYLLGSLLFGSIGLVAFVYGKRMDAWRTLAIGLALMGFPYLVTQTGPMYAVGTGLCAALFFLHD